MVHRQLCRSGDRPGNLGAIAALALPIVISLTGLDQLSGFALVLMLALQLILGIPITGLALGHLQMRMLHRYLRGVAGWQLITPLGLSMGFLIAVIVHFVGNQAISLAGLADSLGQAQGTTGQLLSFGCTTLAIGLGCGFLGLAQYTVLSSKLRLAKQWIMATGASGMAAWLLGQGLFSLIPPLLDGWARSLNLTPTLLGLVISSLAGWFLFQGLLGLVLAQLFQGQARPQPSKPSGQRSAPRPAQHSRKLSRKWPGPSPG